MKGIKNNMKKKLSLAKEIENEFKRLNQEIKRLHKIIDEDTKEILKLDSKLLEYKFKEKN